nr:MAG TPA: hypothetical protein [Caudoviricetes sp.]
MLSISLDGYLFPILSKPKYNLNRFFNQSN